MNLRELVRRLEKIEDKAKQNKDKDTESMVGVLIEDFATTSGSKHVDSKVLGSLANKSSHS